MLSMDLYIFGDIGGHHYPFMQALEKIGVNTETHEVPEGVGIIQVGDLVHRGPNSDELVTWVDAALKVNNKPGTGRWIQLFGNHEGHHIGGPVFSQNVDGKVTFWDLGPDSEKTLKRWWGSNQAQMAVAVTRIEASGEERDVLVTHAGLTSQTWAGIGFPMTAQETVKVLNAQNLKLAFAPGYMLGGYYKSSTGGMQPPSVAWASSGKEVYPSWMGRDALFDQVHGHSTLYNWFSGQWYVDDDIAANIARWKAKRFTRWDNPSGSKFYCIDQALGRFPPQFDVCPLHFTGEILG